MTLGGGGEDIKLNRIHSIVLLLIHRGVSGIKGLSALVGEDIARSAIGELESLGLIGHDSSSGRITLTALAYDVIPLARSIVRELAREIALGHGAAEGKGVEAMAKALVYLGELPACLVTGSTENGVHELEEDPDLELLEEMGVDAYR